MKPITKIKLFVSSPSDTLKERETVEKICDQINHNEGLKRSFHVYVYRWERDYTPDLGPPQKQITKELYDTDIFVGILWNRFGTPTKEYQSGTEEEFKTTLKLIKTGKMSEFCFYQSERYDKNFDKSNNEHSSQKTKVNAFFENNRKTFGVFKYKTIKAFEDKFRKDISEKIDNILKRTYDFESLNKSFNKNGIKKLYTPEFDDLRNHDKKEFILKEESDIFLLAHTGNAFLHDSGNGSPGIFFDSVRQRLSNKKKYKFNVLLLNPYSLEARKIFYAENFNSYKGDISSINEKDLKKGTNYNKFYNCIKSIKRKLDNTLLEVRITNMATDGTILMSKNRLFYEPYVVSRIINRMEKGLSLFEFQVENLLKNKECKYIYNYNQEQCKKCKDEPKCSQNLYKTFSEQFYILWETAISLTEYEDNVNKYKKDFNEYQRDLF